MKNIFSLQLGSIHTIGGREYEIDQAQDGEQCTSCGFPFDASDHDRVFSAIDGYDIFCSVPCIKQ